MIDLDDCYTRHALGFETVEEMYKWMACTELMNEIDDFPLLFLNALDDPCVVLESHDIPKTYVGKCPSGFCLYRHSIRGGEREASQPILT